MGVALDKFANAQPVYLVDGAGSTPGEVAKGGGYQETLTLVAGSAVATPQAAYGGRYAISAFASNWNGASAQVQYQAQDGTTWINFGRPRTVNDVNDPANANAPQEVGVGSNSLVRCAVTGGPATGLYVTLSRIPSA